MTLAWIVELEPGVWLSDTSSGDPPRTLICDNAKMFAGLPSASHAIASARTYRPFAVAREVRLSERKNHDTHRSY